MARLRCEVLERDGRAIRMVRDEGGRVLRLYAEAPPSGAWWVGTLEGTGQWAEAASPPHPAPPEPIEVVWLDAFETVALDEVGVLVGPDRADALGLFDSPTTASTGEHTAGPSSGPASGGERGGGEQRRTAVLAWIAAQAADAPVPAEGGVPCEALKRLVADEPLDPLPALDGVPKPRPAPHPGPEPRRELAPEREDTATQIEGFEGMAERRGADGPAPSEPTASGPAAPDTAPDATPTAPRAAPSPRVLLLVALGVAVIAWVLQAAW